MLPKVAGHLRCRALNKYVQHLVTSWWRTKKRSKAHLCRSVILFVIRSRATIAQQYLWYFHLPKQAGADCKPTNTPQICKTYRKGNLQNPRMQTNVKQSARGALFGICLRPWVLQSASPAIYWHIWGVIFCLFLHFARSAVGPDLSRQMHL